MGVVMSIGMGRKNKTIQTVINGIKKINGDLDTQKH